MATTTAKAFDDFAHKLLLTDAQTTTIHSRKESAHAYLREYFDKSSDMPLLSCKLIGSAERKTIIRPIDDIDVLAVFSNASRVFENYRRDSQLFLYRVRNALSKYSVKVVGARGQAVRLFYSQPPHVDIAPVFKTSGGGFYLPAGDGSWITTDPDRVDRWLASRDQELNHRLKRITRMLKCWNRAHSGRLKSFHLEVLAASSFKSLGNDSREACEVFFRYASTHLSVQDPAGHSGDLASYLTRSKRREVEDTLSAAQKRAKAAINAAAKGNHQEAIRLWRITFGDEFPAYG